MRSCATWVGLRKNVLNNTETKIRGTAFKKNELENQTQKISQIEKKSNYNKKINK